MREGWWGVGVWVGVMVGGQAGLALESALCALVALLPAVLLLRHRTLLLLAGGLCGLLVVGTMPAGPVLRGPMAVHGVVVGAPVGRSADVALLRAGVPGQGLVPRTGRVRLRFPGPAPRLGSEVLAFGEARPLHDALLPGGPPSVAGAHASGIRSQLVARHTQVVGGVTVPAVPPGVRHGGVLQALALGERRLLEPSVLSRLRRTGTSHLLAISGFHVGVVAGAVGGVLALLLRCAAVWRQRGVAVWPAWLVGAGAGVVYALVAGAPVSAQRAALLLVLGAVLRAVGLRPRPLGVLALVGAAILILDPSAAWSPGFQLSMGAVVGLVRLAPALERLRPRRWPSVLRWVWTSLTVTTAATIGTLPAAAWWFQSLAPLSPLANLVAIPVTTGVLAPLAAVACFGPEALSGPAYLLGDVVLDGLMFALAPLDVTPLPIAVGSVGAVALAMALLVHRRLAWLLALVLALAPGPAPPDGLRVTWPDVGQGSAALVEWPDGRRWLVDGGPPSDRLLHWLRRRGVHRLDVVVASHGQDDHAGGLLPVIERLDVGELWLPLGSRDDLQLQPLVAEAVLREIPVVPGPPQDLAGDARAWLADENDRSVALVVAWRGQGVLLPGDVERKGEALLAPSLSEVPTRIVAVAAPHHGSRTSSTPALVAATRPHVVVAQAARWSPYGHPAPDVVQRWSRAGALVYRSDLDGTIELTVGPSRLEVRTWRWDRGWTVERTGPPPGVPWSLAGLEP